MPTKPTAEGRSPLTQNMSSLPVLPPDVWFKILTHLPPSSLHSVSQTCHYLHRIATSDQLFHQNHLQNYQAPLQTPRTHTWRTIHNRTTAIRRSPTYESFDSPIPIIPITDVGDSLLVHIPSHATLHCFPRKWVLEHSFLCGDPMHAVALGDHRFAMVDTANPPCGHPRLHIVDSRTGALASFELPCHKQDLAPIPGRSEILLPAEDFKSLVYYTGVLRVVTIVDMTTIDIEPTGHLLLGESPKPLIEGYAGPTSDGVTVFSLRGEQLTTIPFTNEDKLLTLATNAQKTSFTARILRPRAIVALTRTACTDWWTHLHKSQLTDHAVSMFYNGTRTLLLPGHHSARMTVIQTRPLGGIQTIRAVRVRGAPFDWGAVTYGGDVVVLCARRVGVVSLFDIDSGSCITSITFFRGRVEDVCFVGGAWIVGWRNDGGCVFEAWRFGDVDPMFDSVNEIVQGLGNRV